MADNKVEHKIYFELEDDWHSQKSETLWASHLGGNKYKIENVPFYVKGVSFGDIVNVSENNGELVFQSMATKSGHSTYRIILMPESTTELFQEYWRPMQVIGCTYEKASDNLYSIDVPFSTDIHRAYNLLEQGELSQVWDFEEGDCGHKINNEASS